jgi:hypothetical protein
LHINIYNESTPIQAKIIKAQEWLSKAKMTKFWTKYPSSQFNKKETFGHCNLFPTSGKTYFVGLNRQALSLSPEISVDPIERASPYL